MEEAQTCLKKEEEAEKSKIPHPPPPSPKPRKLVHPNFGTANSFLPF
jgi:hypothetical protein